MRGPYHQALVRLLLEKIRENIGITQESIASVTRMHQTTVSGILKRDAGTFDLDEAEAALDLLNSSLQEFLQDPQRIPGGPPKFTRTEMRALRLLRLMSDGGQKKAVGLLAEAARAFRRPTRPILIQRSGGKRVVIASKGRERRW